MKIAYCVYTLFILLIFILNINANITFGRGLGDAFYLSALFLIYISTSFLYRKLKKNKNGLYVSYFFMITLSAILISFALLLTILRGPEYPWNGKLFLM